LATDEGLDHAVAGVEDNQVGVSTRRDFPLLLLKTE